MILCHWDLVKKSRKITLPMPMDSRYPAKQCHDRTWFSCEPPMTAPSREASEAIRSVMSWFWWVEVLFESAVVEAVRGKCHSGFGLVWCQSNQNLVRECWQHCSPAPGTTVSIEYSLMPALRSGWHDKVPSQCWLLPKPSHWCGAIHHWESLVSLFQVQAASQHVNPWQDDGCNVL